jgi:peroxiredoxin
MNQNKQLQIGEVAPDFALRNIDGKLVSLKEYRGKKLLVSFYRYAACPLCNLRIYELITKHDELQKKGLYMIAFFQSPRESILEYVGKQKPPFPIITDPSREIYKLYGVESSLAKALRAVFRMKKFRQAATLGFKGGNREGDKKIVPADFLINEKGVIHMAYYGKDISDHLPLHEIEKFLILTSCKSLMECSKNNYKVIKFLRNNNMNKQIFKGITRNIFILGVVSLFTDLSSQMVFPLIPLFMVSVLGAGAYAVGIVEGAAETTASIFKVISGYWSDKIKKRKPFILLGYSLSSLTKPLFALATVWYFCQGNRKNWQRMKLPQGMPL